MRRVTTVLAGLVVLFVVGAGLWLWRERGSPKSVRDQASATPAAVPVTVFEARSGRIPRIIAGVGLVTALQSVTVRSRVDGEVLSISFAEGDTVKAGDVLAQIDPRQLESALIGAQAKRTQDAALLETAKADLDRYTALAQKNIVSTQTLDQKSAAVKQLEGKRSFPCT